MHTFRILSAAAVVFLTVSACKKEKNTPHMIDPGGLDTPVVTYSNYTQLKPGNYWIYQDYMIDSIGGAAHALGTFDSNFVEKDTVINGNTYHKYCDVSFSSGSSNPSYDIYLLRDSLSYTVNQAGRILFSSTDFTTVFSSRNYVLPGSQDTLLVTEQMGYKHETTTVDGGTFITSAMRQIYHYPEYYHPFGYTREYVKRYSDGVGLISETSGFYDLAPQYYERRLVRYHVQ